MWEQNQSWVQINWQAVVGGNPYDLIDNQGQVVQQNQSVQQMPQQTMQAVVQTPIENIPVQPVVSPQVAPVQNVSVANPVVNSTKDKLPKEPGGFLKKLIGFIAKMSGQPDPETWVKKAQSIVPTQAPVANSAVPTSVDVIVNNQTPNTNSAQNPFDSIMWWVTGFLDKVEEKVEKVSWVNFDAAMNTPSTQAEPVQPVVPVISEPVVAPEKNQIQDETEKQKPTMVETVPVQVPKANVAVQPVVPAQEVQASVQGVVQPEVVVNQTPVVSTPVEAVKTEIETVTNNENVSVNPIAVNVEEKPSVSVSVQESVMPVNPEVTVASTENTVNTTPTV